jgi:hypothetical protein
MIERVREMSDLPSSSVVGRCGVGGCDVAASEEALEEPPRFCWNGRRGSGRRSGGESGASMFRVARFFALWLGCRTGGRGAGGGGGAAKGEVAIAMWLNLRMGGIEWTNTKRLI